MKKLFALLCGILLFSGGTSNALNTPTGFVISVPTSATANPLTTLRIRFAALDSINRANGDTVSIRNATDSSLVFQFGYDASLFTAAKDTTLSGLKPRTIYNWIMTVDSSSVRKSATAATDTTAWITQETPARVLNVMSILASPMRSATSIVPGIISPPLSNFGTTVDTTTITLHGADIESTIVYIPLKYTSITAITSATDSIVYSIWPYVGKMDSLTGWYSARDNTDSCAVTTATKNQAITMFATTPAPGFYIVLKGWAGTKKVLPIKLFMNRERY